MALNIYDGMNWFRIALETGSHTIRQLYYQLACAQGTSIVVWEGRGGNERRRKLYLEYKKNRVRPAEDIFKTVELFKQILQHAGVYQITMPGYEGDDVIASLVKMYAPIEKDIFVHSSDKDFRQLIPLGVKVNSNPIKVCDDKYIRLYKTLVGDPSDNIKGLQGFGEVAFSRLDCKYVQPFFEREEFGNFLPELAFMEQKHFIKLQRDLPLIAVYWKITGFFDIPLSEMAPHLQLGINNSAAAEDLMRRYIIN